MASRSRPSSMGHDWVLRYLLLLFFLRIFAYERNLISGFTTISMTLERRSSVSLTKMRKNSSENFWRSMEYEERQLWISSDLAEKISSKRSNSKTISSSHQSQESARKRLRRSSWIWRGRSTSRNTHLPRERSREIHRIWLSSRLLCRWDTIKPEWKRSSQASTRVSHSRSARSRPYRDLRNNYEFSRL